MIFAFLNNHRVVLHAARSFSTFSLSEVDPQVSFEAATAEDTAAGLSPASRYEQRF